MVVAFLRVKEDDFRFFRSRESLFAENQVSALIRFETIFYFILHALEMLFRRLIGL